MAQDSQNGMVVLHKKSVNGKPQSDSLLHGEIAINYNKGDEAIFIKNNNDEVVTFSTGSTESCKCGPRWSYLGLVEFEVVYTTTNNEKLNLPESNSVILHEWDDATNKGNIQFNANGVPKMFFYLQDTLKTIEIIAPCPKIGMEAFRGCTSLEQITLGNTVIKLGERAFQNCQPLNNVTIPEGVKEIPDACFIGCHITTTDSNGNKTYKDGLITLNLPNSLEKIGAEAFEDCTGLVNLKMPKNVKSIGARAFQQCEKLTITDWDFFANLEELGDKAFQSCHELRFPNDTLEIPEKITELEPEVFSYCYYINEIKLHSGVTKLGQKAFYTAGGGGGRSTDRLRINKINIPSSVKFIGKQCFASDRSGDGYSSSQQGHVSINTIDVEDINDYVMIDFEDKNSHPNDSISRFHSKLLINGEEVRDIEITANITELDQYMFRHIENIDSISFPNTLNRIGTRAFESCSVKSIDLSNCKNLSFIGNYAFSDSYDLDLNMDGCDLSDVEENAFSGGGFITLTLSNTNIKEMPKGIRSANEINLSGSKIESVGEKACYQNYVSVYDFSNCKELKSIGRQAFSTGQTETVKLNGCYNLESIGEQAFGSCSKLSSIEMSGLENLTTLVKKAFEKCTSLRSIDLSGCPNLMTIGDELCNGTTMVEEIDLSVCPKLTTIGNKAFPHVTKLKVNDTATYLGEMTRWTSNASSSNVLKEVIIKGTSKVVDGLSLSNPTYYVEESMLEQYKSKYPKLTFAKINS